MTNNTQKQKVPAVTRQVTLTLDNDTWDLLEQCSRRKQVSPDDLVSWSVKRGRDFCDYEPMRGHAVHS